jgi:Protein of unknown function (DUF2845)
VNPWPGLVPATLAVAVALSLLPSSARADSIRCEGGIVSSGDSKLDLLGKCGEPSLREAKLTERELLSGGGPSALLQSSRVTVEVERWTYNFGPRQFLQVVRVEAGEVRGVERGSYGSEVGRSTGPAVIPRAACEPIGFGEGLTTFEVLARCGPPATRDQRLVTRSVARTDQNRQPVAAESETFPVELWTYDFGPQALTRRLEFSDGRLVRVETGSYGYSR